MRSVPPPSAPARKSRPTGPARANGDGRPAPASNTASPPLPAPLAARQHGGAVQDHARTRVQLDVARAAQRHQAAIAIGQQRMVLRPRAQVGPRPPTSSVAPAATCTPTARPDPRGKTAVLHAPARRQLPQHVAGLDGAARRGDAGLDIHPRRVQHDLAPGASRSGSFTATVSTAASLAAQPGLVQPGRAQADLARRPALTHRDLARDARQLPGQRLARLVMARQMLPPPTRRRAAACCDCRKPSSAACGASVCVAPDRFRPSSRLPTARAADTTSRPRRVPRCSRLSAGAARSAGCRRCAWPARPSAHASARSPRPPADRRARATARTGGRPRHAASSGGYAVPHVQRAPDRLMSEPARVTSSPPVNVAVAAQQPPPYQRSLW